MRNAAALILFAALPSFAASQHVIGTRVSLTDYPRAGPVLPIVTGSPVRLTVFFSQVPPMIVSAPIADLDGNTITITQSVTRGGTEETSLYLLDFGALPAGAYRATLTRSFADSPGVPSETESRTFIVQSPPPTSLCTAMPPSGRSLIRLTSTAGGNVHLHFEETRPGYSPVYDRPSVVDIRNGQIDIEQPFTDTADYTLPGAPPAHDTCHAEDIDLGTLPAGGYRLSWRPLGTLGGNGPTTFGGGGMFVWSGTEMLCSSEPVFSASPGVVLALSRVMLTRYITPPTATISGNTITVTDYVDTECCPQPVPAPLLPACGPSVINIGSLAPGEYTVNWFLQDVLAAPALIGTYHFTAPVPRAHAARR